LISSLLLSPIERSQLPCPKEPAAPKMQYNNMN
jgi:hypothetical protein